LARRIGELILYSRTSRCRSAKPTQTSVDLLGAQEILSANDTPAHI
jgi:hypothetical protein